MAIYSPPTVKDVPPPHKPIGGVPPAGRGSLTAAGKGPTRGWEGVNRVSKGKMLVVISFPLGDGIFGLQRFIPSV